MDTTCDREFWQRHPGLVWSNRNADDGVRIRAALSRPRFEQLRDIAGHYGLERVESEWRYLAADDADEVRRAAPVVERILRNLATGQARAAA